jgi:hypothetical protein
MTAAALPIIATVGGALISQMAANKAADKQQNIIEDANAAAKKRTDSNVRMGIDEAKKFDPTMRKQAQDELEGQLLTSNLGAIQGAGSTAENTNTGNVSSDYDAGKAKAMADRTKSGIDMAKLFAKMKAPNQLRLDESVRQGDMSSMMAQNNATANNLVQAGQNDASTVRPNGLLSLLGTAARAYGAYKGGQLAKTPGTITGQPAPTGSIFGGNGTVMA